jgi:hypothetical protein
MTDETTEVVLQHAACAYTVVSIWKSYSVFVFFLALRQRIACRTRSDMQVFQYCSGTIRLMNHCRNILILFEEMPLASQQANS